MCERISYVVLEFNDRNYLLSNTLYKWWRSIAPFAEEKRRP